MSFDDWLRRAREDERIVGVALTGSRGRGALVQGTSDWDVRVAVIEGEGDHADSLETPHGSEIEVAATTLSGFRDWPEWDRYSFAHATVLVDKLDGEFERIVRRLGLLTEKEAATVGREALGVYTNSLYRSLRNDALGLHLAARLDAADATSSLVTAIFAFEGRIRPFNKYLVWELDAHPLADWNASNLVSLIAGALTGEPTQQTRLFQRAESQIRRHGLGDVVDDWAPHVALLRGE